MTNLSLWEDEKGLQNCDIGRSSFLESFGADMIFHHIGNQYKRDVYNHI